MTYKRLLNEYNKCYNNEEKEINFNYKLIILDSGENVFKSEIIIKINNINYKVDIFYDNKYPFKAPTKVKINNKDIFTYYKDIMKNNNDILSECPCCKSLLCSGNWCAGNTILDILKEIIKIINYNNLKVYRKLLKTICDKYVNESVDYLHYYLI